MSGESGIIVQSWFVFDTESSDHSQVFGSLQRRAPGRNRPAISAIPPAQSSPDLLLGHKPGISGRRRIVIIRLPVGRIVFSGLIAPGGPTRSDAAPKELQERAGRTSFDQIVLLIRFAAMLAFPGL